MRNARGSVSVELMGFLPLLLIMALLVWQLLLFAWAATSAENAARSASRAVGLGADAKLAAKRALPKPLRPGLRTEVHGDKATVVVRVPILVPGFTDEELAVDRDAELPSA
jgi:TadE-like protein